MSLKSIGAKIAIGITMLVVGVFADQLTITGTVKDSAGAAVAGAIVRAGNGGTALRDTADATGAYTLVIANNTATSVMVFVQTGTGIGGGFTMGTATVAAPGDGTADAATVNLVTGAIIQPLDGDTAVISGTVKDSSGAAVANVVVTVRFGGGGFGGSRDTTDASGAYSIRAVNTNASTTVTVTATLTPRTGTATGTIAAPANGTTDLVTVNVTIGSVVQPARGDTVVVSGTVKDSLGAAVANAVVTLSFGGGGSMTVRDTADASGNYSISAVNTNRSRTVTVTSRVNNATGSVNAAIDAPSDGAVDRVTANIVIGQRVNPVLKTPAMAPLRITQSVTGVYLLNGSRVSKSVLTNAKTAVPRTAIVKYRNTAEAKLLLNK